MRRRILLGLVAATALLALKIVFLGGIDWRIARGIALRSRDPLRPGLVALLFVLTYAWTDRAAFARDVARVLAAIRVAAPGIALVCVIALGWVAVRYGTFTAGGSDPYGYLSQAYGWLDGTLPKPVPVPISLPWPLADASLAPLGYRPGVHQGTVVPTYSPGLPIMMAGAARLAGAAGPFFVVPLFACALVWTTFLLGRAVAGRHVGALAAILTTTSPIVLFQSVWVMTDVPVAALWTGVSVAALRTSWWSVIVAGVTAAVALLVRPNLPLLVAAVMLYYVLRGPTLLEGLKRAILFAVVVAPAAAAVAALNTMWYGGPLNSGYGTTDDLYSVARVWPNLRRYSLWFVQSQSWYVLLFLAPLLAPVRRAAGARGALLLYLLIAATWASYLAYRQFDAWWYLRFLLPAIPATLVLTAVSIKAIARRLPHSWGVVPAVLLAGLLVSKETVYLRQQTELGRIQTDEHRYIDIGRFVATLPPNAVVLAMQHSGSVRFYGNRVTVRYDQLDGGWLSRAPGILTTLGYRPYAVADDWELPDIRRRLGLPENAPLPWRVIAGIRDRVGVTVFDLSAEAASAPPVSLTSDERRYLVRPRTIP